jgi:hypothetical protein
MPLPRKVVMEVVLMGQVTQLLAVVAVLVATVEMLLMLVLGSGVVAQWVVLEVLDYLHQ